MNIGIVGWRLYTNYLEFTEKIKLLNLPMAKIISGGATGADTLAEKYASENNIPIEIFRADWKKYGKSAGPIRNTQIVDNSDVLIAFISSQSKGTWDTVRKAEKKNIAVHKIFID